LKVGDSGESTEPASLERARSRSLLQRFTSRFLEATGTVLGCGFFIAITAGIGYFVFTSGLAPIGFFAITWFGCAVLVMADNRPWERTRVGLALLVGWLVDLLLYRLAIVWTPGAFRHFVPGIIVASVYAAYLTWRVTESYTRPSEEGRISKLDNPMWALASLLLAIFLMSYVVGPGLSHFFPPYWQRVTSALFNSFNESDSDDRGY
jgi:hypothetical protein